MLLYDRINFYILTKQSTIFIMKVIHRTNYQPTENRPLRNIQGHKLIKVNTD